MAHRFDGYNRHASTNWSMMTMRCRFSLKGGTLLQHTCSASLQRATKDIDRIVRGDLDEFLELMDEQFVSPKLGGRSSSLVRRLSRLGCQAKHLPACQVRRNRFSGEQTWRKIKVEVSPDEGMAGSAQDLSPRRRLRVWHTYSGKACRYGHVLSGGLKNSCSDRSS